MNKIEIRGNEGKIIMGVVWGYAVLVSTVMLVLTTAMA